MAENNNLSLQPLGTDSTIPIVDLTSDNNPPNSVNSTDDLTRKNLSMSVRSKHAPTIPIYRPPILRSRDNIEMISGMSSLNVDAKEFVMNGPVSKITSVPIKKDEGLEAGSKAFPLNTSKSSGNVTMSNGSTKVDFSQKSKNFKNLSISFNNYGLKRAKSSGNVLTSTCANGIVGGRVQFQKFDPNNNRLFAKSNPIRETKFTNGANLQRSKSEGSEDTLKLSDVEISSFAFNEYHLFPEFLRFAIKQAIENCNQISDKHKIILARTVVEHALVDRKLSVPVTKLSAIIIMKDETEAYLDSFINTCQMLYQKREIYSLKESEKLATFVSFLTTFYTELKQNKSQPAKKTLLNLITRCCEDILTKRETHSLFEVECVYQALTTLGRDIESELPTMFVKIFHFIKVIFVKGRNESSVQKLLLQLIELRAAKWQLPVSALNYYYPKI